VLTAGLYAYLLQFFSCIFFLTSGGWVKIKLNLPHFTYQIHVVCQFNPTLPLQQQLSPGRVSMSTRPDYLFQLLPLPLP